MNHALIGITRIVTLICLASTLSFAGTWSGLLVDSRCYEAEERNVNPTDTLTSVDRDGIENEAMLTKNEYQVLHGRAIQRAEF